ncbi:MAG TPA: hypothetical protein VJ323_02040 [Bryobacteraceae bacterium]|nr:hypothetical protein [Bryobacteraceae bacterium]
MSHTVAAIFESESQANQARSELINLGIPSDDIFIRNDTEKAQRASSTEDVAEDTGIGSFFKRLFGFEDNDDRTTYYSRAIGEGRYLVAVDASTDDQAERAADMMQRLGALDIDDDIDDLDLSRSTTPLGAEAGAAPMSRSGVRVYARPYDIPAEEKARLRDVHAVEQRRPVEQLAAEDKPRQHPHLETMEDDPYTPSSEPKQSQ